MSSSTAAPGGITITPSAFRTSAPCRSRFGEALHAVTAACLRIWNRGQNPVPGAAEHLLYQLTAALERVDTEGEDVEAIHQQAAAMLAVWIEHVAPQLRHVAAVIELRMEGSIGGVRVQGTADVITEAGMVVDLKTSKRKPAGVSQSHRLQLATYCALADQATTSHGRRQQHTAARLVTITRTKTPAAVPQTIEITEADFRYAEWAYRTAQEEMRAGSILPRRSSLLCSRENCAYWQQCEDEYGGCVKE